MDNIKISKATDRYSCNLCRKHFNISNNLYDINVGSINICLCTDCFRKLRVEMDRFILRPVQIESEEYE